MDTPLQDDPTRPRASRLRTAAVGAGLGIAALVGVGAATATLAGAQSDDAPPSTEAPEAQSDDAPSDDAGPERGEWLSDALAPLVDDGTLTQEQSDAVVERLRAAGDAARERFGDRMGERRGHGPRGVFGGPGTEAVAELLGMTREEIAEALRGDATLADLAADAGVTTEQLVDAMLSGVEEHLAERVAAGDITQEQADERLAEATERATAIANGERPERPDRGDRPDDASLEGSAA